MITLLDAYFKINNRVTKDNETLFDITLLPDYCVYEGHFPGNPVSPGVCNIQMIKECAEQLTGRQLFLGYISQCRLSAVMTPQTTPQFQLCIQLSEVDDMYKVRATVYNDTTTYIDFKGELTPVK